jgi:hypothetical protein
VSDPLAVPRTAALMLEGGIDPKAVEQTTWGNPLEVYLQSGQIDEQELMSAPRIDQRQLFHDSTVLRGQEPRVDPLEPSPGSAALAAVEGPRR